MTDYVQPANLIAFMTARGYRAEPFTNLIEAADCADLRILGYHLLGPRGHKTTLLKNRDGLLSLSAARLWCDSVDYATAQKRA